MVVRHCPHQSILVLHSQTSTSSYCNTRVLVPVLHYQIMAILRVHYSSAHEHRRTQCTYTCVHVYTHVHVVLYSWIAILEYTVHAYVHVYTCGTRVLFNIAILECTRVRTRTCRYCNILYYSNTCFRYQYGHTGFRVPVLTMLPVPTRIEIQQVQYCNTQYLLEQLASQLQVPRQHAIAIPVACQHAPRVLQYTRVPVPGIAIDVYHKNNYLSMHVCAV